MISDTEQIPGYDPANVVRSITVEIRAPASTVWQVLTDLPKYGEWNPHCVKCESTLELGAPVKMTLRNHWNKQLGLAVEYLCAFEPDRLLAWQAPWVAEWPYPARRDQVITTLAPDRCTYYSTDAFFGEEGAHVMRMAAPWVKEWFDAVARALKERAEAIYVSEVEPAYALTPIGHF